MLKRKKKEVLPVDFINETLLKKDIGKPGWVYFIITLPSRFEEITNLDGRINVKIGLTTVNLEKRRRQLKTGCPQDLFIYNSIYTADSRFLEGLLHDDYKDRRKLGSEWFRMTLEEVDGIITDITGSSVDKK